MQDILAEELNVKKVEIVPGSPKRKGDESFEKIVDDSRGTYPSLALSRQTMILELDTKLTDELKTEGLMREIVRQVQESRKKAGLNVDDRIQLRLETNSKEVQKAIDQFKDAIWAETLTTGDLAGQASYAADSQIDGQALSVHLSKS